jgi:hypothetical protein
MPDAFTQPDKAAARAQRQFLRWTKWFLVLNVGAAALGAAALSNDRAKQAAMLATALFAIGFLLTGRIAAEKPNRQWYDFRAAAESAKTLAVQYAVGGGPFGLNAPDADRQFREAVRAIPAALSNLPAIGPQGDPITPGLQEIRDRPRPERQEIYLRDRVQDQRVWYLNEALANQRAAARWRNVTFFCQALGIGGGAVRAAGLWDVNLLGIAAALTATAAAWMRTKDYEGLAEAYKVTGRELEKVEAEGRNVMSEDEWAEYVGDAENAFSREHTLWLARRS